MIKVKEFYLNELRECCYILSDESKECIIVDPGISSQSERDRIVKYIESEKLKPVKIVCTHGHFDHVMGNAFITDKYQIPTYLNPKDIPLLERAPHDCLMFGYQIEQPPLKTLDIKEGEDITFGNSVLKVISTPGHTSGSVCVYAPEDKFVLTGDTLFAGSCGRTDLPESEEDAMPDSLNKIAREMPADYIVYPGHGPNSTMRDELMQNPFLRDKGF